MVFFCICVYSSKAVRAWAVPSTSGDSKSRLDVLRRALVVKVGHVVYELAQKSHGRSPSLLPPLKRSDPPPLSPVLLL